MKGIYLTQQKKQELEEQRIHLIVLAEEYRQKGHTHRKTGALANSSLIEDILSEAIVLPEYSNWEDVDFFPPDNESQMKKTLQLKNGVIIKKNETCK
jgi:hypothetical protein